MKRITCLSIQVPSRPGVLGEIYRTLESAGVKSHALMAPDTVGSGVVHILPEPVERARDVLNELNYPFSLDEVFILELPGKKGLVGELIATLAIARINIEFIFTSDMGRIILAVDDPDRAETILRENFLPKLP